MPEPLSIARLLENLGEELSLECVAGRDGLKRSVHIAELNRPSLALAGFTDFFSWDRIQVIGVTEMRYLDCLTPDVCEARIRKIYEFELPCVIITTNTQPFPAFIQQANQRNIPLLLTRQNTARLYSSVMGYMSMHFAPSMRVHGNLVDVYGMGMLIVGRSGVGKSECALELVERGHRLITDDVVVIKRPTGESLMGFSNNVLQHHIEVRGLGIMNVETLFGIGAVLPKKQIDLIVRLEKYDPDKPQERLGLDTKYTNLLGARVPEYNLAVRPGRNIAILAEVAALNQRLTNAKRNPATMFANRQMHMMRPPRQAPSVPMMFPAGGGDPVASANIPSATIPLGTGRDVPIGSWNPGQPLPPNATPLPPTLTTDSAQGPSFVEDRERYGHDISETSDRWSFDEVQPRGYDPSDTGARRRAAHPPEAPSFPHPPSDSSTPRHRAVEPGMWPDSQPSRQPSSPREGQP